MAKSLALSPIRERLSHVQYTALRAGLVTLCLYKHSIWTQFQVREL